MTIAEDHQKSHSEIKVLEQELAQRYADKLTVNHDLDRTLVSFQANKKENGYSWCKYKEGFSAALVRYILRKTRISSGRILDPFAGSGTALFVASEQGLGSDGIELLPSSGEIIGVRHLVEFCDKRDLASRIRTFLEARPWESRGRTSNFPHLRITAGAFPVETESCLGRYLCVVAEIGDETLKRVLKFAAFCVLESISYTRKDGQYLRWDYRAEHGKSGKTFNKGKILSFSEAITNKLKQFTGDLDGEPSLFDSLGAGKQRGTIELNMGSCLDILPELKTRYYSGIITSPPYCNRYDYTRTYALELAMLGVSGEELKNLRQAMLSCTVENRVKENLDSNFSRSTFAGALKAFERQELLQRIVVYLEGCKRDGSLNNTGIPRMVRNYFWEMALVIFECGRVLKSGAPFVMVNDTVRYQGVHVLVDLILSDFAVAAGFTVDSVWVLPKGKGNSSQQMGLHGREEIRKCVYVWRRATGRRAKKRVAELA